MAEVKPVDQNQIETFAQALCMEECAFRGEPPCFTMPGEWPNPECNEPGCMALAFAVADLANPTPSGGD